MQTKIDRVLEIAGRLKVLELEGVRLRAELEALLGVPKPGTRKPKVGTPIAEGVRRALKAGKPLPFRDIVAAVGNGNAAKAALRKLRARGDVKLSGGKYVWKGAP